MTYILYAEHYEEGDMNLSEAIVASDDYEKVKSVCDALCKISRDAGNSGYYKSYRDLMRESSEFENAVRNAMLSKHIYNRFCKNLADCIYVHEAHFEIAELDCV